MLKETIKFNNLDGVEVERVLYFNISTLELGELNKEAGGNLERSLSESANGNGLELFLSIGNLLLKAYGERSEDGDGFNKSPEIREKFKNSLAYDAFIEKLLSNPETFENFTRNLLSGSVRKVSEMSINPEMAKVVDKLSNEREQQNSVNKDSLHVVPTTQPMSAKEQLEKLLAEHPELRN